KGPPSDIKTRCGKIEFTHTKGDPIDSLENTSLVGRPLRLETKQPAYRDLKRGGRYTPIGSKVWRYEN
ncbi:hypothetical protein CWB81_20970, partial [Pseudoalteromonas sp. S1688]